MARKREKEYKNKNIRELWNVNSLIEEILLISLERLERHACKGL